MQASRPLTSGAADAVSTVSSYGYGYTLPVTRATVTSDSSINQLSGLDVTAELEDDTQRITVA